MQTCAYSKGDLQNHHRIPLLSRTTNYISESFSPTTKFMLENKEHGEEGICHLHSCIRNKVPKFQINSDAKLPSVLMQSVFTSCISYTDYSGIGFQSKMVKFLGFFLIYHLFYYQQKEKFSSGIFFLQHEKISDIHHLFIIQHRNLTI